MFTTTLNHHVYLPDSKWKQSTSNTRHNLHLSSCTTICSSIADLFIIDVCVPEEGDDHIVQEALDTWSN